MKIKLTPTERQELFLFLDKNNRNLSVTLSKIKNKLRSPNYNHHSGDHEDEI
jgi:hypothetical protein